jgi:hypothetical protein
LSIVCDAYAHRCSVKGQQREQEEAGQAGADAAEDRLAHEHVRPLKTRCR